MVPRGGYFYRALVCPCGLGPAADFVGAALDRDGF